MSRFEDFCNAVSTSQQMYERYEKECYEFGKKLVERINSHFEVPQGKLKYFPLDREPIEGQTYYFRGAIHLAEDGYWQLGVRIILSKANSDFNQPAVILRLLFKKEASKFLVKLGNTLKEKEFAVATLADEAFVPFLDYLANQILESFTTRSERFINQNVSRKIGFEPADQEPIESGIAPLSQQ